jgi:hypothetical protein
MRAGLLLMVVAASDVVLKAEGGQTKNLENGKTEKMKKMKQENQQQGRPGRLAGAARLWR